MLFRFLVAAACASALFAQSGAVRCGRMLDVRSGTLAENAVIAFDDGKITALGRSAVPPIDLSGETCLPGLIDVHDHLTMDPRDSGYQSLGVSVPREALTGAKNARLTLRAGFTTIRNVGADGFTDVALRDAIDDGDVEGP